MCGVCEQPVDCAEGSILPVLFFFCLQRQLQLWPSLPPCHTPPPSPTLPPPLTSAGPVYSPRSPPGLLSAKTRHQATELPRLCLSIRIVPSVTIRAAGRSQEPAGVPFCWNVHHKTHYMKKTVCEQTPSILAVVFLYILYIELVRFLSREGRGGKITTSSV